MTAQHRQGDKEGFIQLLEKIMETSAMVNRNMDALIRIEKQRKKRAISDQDLFRRVLNAPNKSCQLRK